VVHVDVLGAIDGLRRAGVQTRGDAPEPAPVGDRRAFVYTPERDYREVERRQTIVLAFEGWESVTFDAGSFVGTRAALRCAIDAARTIATSERHAVDDDESGAVSAWCS
jgi:hypothetical protein